MIFRETPLAGAYVISLERREDERGFFARTWCAREMVAHGLDNCVAQSNTSFNKLAGTVRGMHYQASPHEEAKVVRCTRGAIYDVIVDIRPQSPTLGQWFGVELNEDNRDSLYIPKGFAHGFQTLLDNTEVVYLMSEYYAPGFDRGICHNDPVLQLQWPIPVRSINDKDLNWPAFDRDRIRAEVSC